jgi:5'-methylthioadenosine phosphorylase
MQADVGLIGGTGVGERLAALGGSPVHVPTSEGVVRGRLLEFEGVRLYLLSRHSAGHQVPPHLVNYRGMALALEALGVGACLSTAAVGSLRRDWGPGTLIACSDFIDLSGRNQTLFDRTVVHRDFSEPFSHLVRDAILVAPMKSALSASWARTSSA